MSFETEKAEAIRQHIAGNWRVAETAYRRMIAAGVSDQDVFNNLGVICLNTSRLKVGAEMFRAALAINPDFAEAHSGLGSVLCSSDPQQAEQEFNKAIALQPAFFQAKYNLANLLWKLGRLSEAVKAYRQALADNPNFVAAHFNMSMVLLLMGNLEEGFTEYEYRLRRQNYLAAINLPDRQWLWDGDMQTRYQVVLVAEPGFGDIFQFMRYGRMLRDKGIYVILQAKASLGALLGTSGCYDELVGLRQPLDASSQRWYPLFSLPYLMGTTLGNIPADIPYLHADKQFVKRWKKTLPKKKKLIGINWQGNPHHERTMNEGRSIPLEKFSVISKLPGVCLVSLQKYHGLEQIETCSFRDNLMVFGEDVYPSEPAFLEAAALIQSMDIVITSDTSTAHLAGALGVPVWVVLPYIPDWRWLMDREDTSWYPTMKLYRQPAAGDWDTVFKKISSDLKKL